MSDQTEFEIEGFYNYIVSAYQTFMSFQTLQRHSKLRANMCN